MPWYSTAETTLTCPNCGREATPPAGIIAFRWGAIPERYRRGDAIRWLTDDHRAVVEPFRLIGTLDSLRYNFGEPRLRHVIAFDADPNLYEYECDRCHARFEAIAVRIRDGRVEGGLAFLPGQCQSRFSRAPAALALVEVTDSGASLAHDEWFDPPLIPLASS